MDTVETDHLIEDYLRRLEHAAAHMRRDRRAEIVAEIRAHIDTALRQEKAGGEAAVRNVLDRLGPPEEIIGAAGPPARDRRAGVLEIVALVALVVPLIGWLVGTVLVLASRIWSGRDKLIGGLLLLLPIAVLSLTFVAGSRMSQEATPSGDIPPLGQTVEDPRSVGPLELVFFIPALPSALYLGWRLRRGPSPTES